MARAHEWKELRTAQRCTVVGRHLEVKRPVVSHTQHSDTTGCLRFVLTGTILATSWSDVAT